MANEERNYGQLLVEVFNRLIAIRRVYPRFKHNEVVVKALQDEITFQESRPGVTIPAQIVNKMLRPEEMALFKQLFYSEEKRDITPVAPDDNFPDAFRKVKSLADIVRKEVIFVPLIEYVDVSYTYTFISTDTKNGVRRNIEVRFEFFMPKDQLEKMGYGSRNIEAPIPRLTRVLVYKGDTGYHDFIYPENDEWNEATAEQIHGWKSDDLEDSSEIIERSAGMITVSPKEWEKKKKFPYFFVLEDHDYSRIKLEAKNVLPDKWWEKSVDEIITLIDVSSSANIRPGPTGGRMLYSSTRTGRPLGRPTVEKQMKLEEILFKPGVAPTPRNKVVSGKVARAREILKRRRAGK